MISLVDRVISIAISTASGWNSGASANPARLTPIDANACSTRLDYNPLQQPPLLELNVPHCSETETE